MEKFIFKNDNGTCSAALDINGENVCLCKIDYSADSTWTVSSWYTEKSFCNKGYGRKTMEFLLRNMVSLLGLPSEVNYIWNGKNQYVFDWMERNFDAVSSCPLAVQKNQSDDDWESHVYVLSRNKFLSYFELL